MPAEGREEKRMQLKLTYRASGKFDIDLMVAAEQKIAETIQILTEKDLLDEETADSIRYIKSLRTKNQVDILLTYSEAKIYSGDILELEEYQGLKGGK